MKTKITLPLYIFTALCLLFSGRASAHFGSKGPYGGGYVSCAIAKDSLVYIGTVLGGVFESTTNQLTAWRSRPVGMHTSRIQALAHSGSYLFAGTDSGVYIFNGFQGSDRYWNRINSGLGNLNIRSLVAIDSITMLAGSLNGLYKTTNKGASWSKVNYGMFDAYPQASRATVISMVKAGSRIYALTKDSGVFISDDQGNSWSDFNNSLTLKKISGSAMSYNSANDMMMISNGFGLFAMASASTSPIAGWSSASAGLPSGTQALALSNNGSNWYMTTYTGVYVSAASSINWSIATTGLPSKNDVVTAIVGLQDRVIVGTREDGIYKCTSGTYNWSPLNSGFNALGAIGMVAAGDSLVIAVTTKGVFVSKDLATTYVASNNGIPPMGLPNTAWIIDLVFSEGRLFAAIYEEGIYTSADSGLNWTAMNSGLPTKETYKIYTAAHYIYTLTDNKGLYRYNAKTGGSWTIDSSGLPASVVPTSMTSYGGKIIMSAGSEGVYIRDLNTGSWTNTKSGFSNRNVTSVTASGNKIFAGTLNGGVFITDFSNPVSWAQVSPVSIPHTVTMNLDGSDIHAMASNKGYVYASYRGGLAATSDNGQTWIPAGNQFNLPSYTKVHRISFVSSRVFMTTEGNGLYSGALAELPLLSDSLSLSQDTIHSPAVPAATYTVSVTSNRSWTVSANQGWIMLNKTSGTGNEDFVITLSSNPGANRSGTVTVTAGSVIRTITIIQDGSSGIENPDASSLRIYPNPSSGSFTIDLSSFGEQVEELSIYNIRGELLQRTVTDPATFLLKVEAGYPEGIYILQLSTSKGMAVRKLVIQ